MVSTREHISLRLSAAILEDVRKEMAAFERLTGVKRSMASVIENRLRVAYQEHPVEWNKDTGVPIDEARRFETNISPFNAVISPTQFESCKKDGHRGFQRSDGYWCITCSKMFKNSTQSKS